MRPNHTSNGAVDVVTDVDGKVVVEALFARLITSIGSPVATAPESATACPDVERDPFQENRYVPLSAAVSLFQ